MRIVLCCIFFAFLGFAYGDTPANCTYDDIRGDWVFLEGKRESNSSISCSKYNDSRAVHTLKLTLLFPNVAFDNFGNVGYWTIVYNQGFEVVINYRKYFAFSLYRNDSHGTVSYCDKILPGWSHDVLGENWACYTGHRISNSGPPKISPPDVENLESSRTLHYAEMADEINRVQGSWTAKMYPELRSLSTADLIRRAGGSKSRIMNPPPAAPLHRKLLKAARELPEQFDWRNVRGVNYVSPVRNQASCGSCYAFSSMAMLEARLRIMTNNTQQVVFSPQDIVSCSIYSQGCEGGFPYVIAGKYAQDFGALPEECFPYEGHDGDCTAKKCKRFYVAKYKYVGGFYGGCNEDLMKMDIVQNGPVTVAFEVYPDFMMYHGGIYHHTGVGASYNPFREVNHGVLITGYGVDSGTGEKYWIVKNSWGTTWGEQGYFKIRRGTNECNIESLAVSAIPIP